MQDGFVVDKRTTRTMAGIYGILPDLPRTLRFMVCNCHTVVYLRALLQEEFVFVLGLVPTLATGEAKDMRYIFEPLTDEWRRLEKGVVIRTHDYPNGRIVKYQFWVTKLFVNEFVHFFAVSIPLPISFSQ